MKKSPITKSILLFLFLASTVVHGAISIVNTVNLDSPGGQIPSYNYGSYDASGVDKLVVLVAYGRDRGSVGPGIASVTYNGTPLIEAIEINSVTGTPSGATTGIFYLDNPGAAGNLIVNRGAAAWGARSGITIFELDGTLPGVGPVAFSSNASSIDLTTASANSLVLAVAKSTRDQTVETPQAPLTSVYANAARHGAGYQYVASPSTVSNPFTLTNVQTGDSNAIVAAAFEPVPDSSGGVIPEPSAALLGVLGILGLLRRRR